MFGKKKRPETSLHTGFLTQHTLSLRGNDTDLLDKMKISKDFWVTSLDGQPMALIKDYGRDAAREILNTQTSLIDELAAGELILKKHYKEDLQTPISTDSWRVRPPRIQVTFESKPLSEYEAPPYKNLTFEEDGLRKTFNEIIKGDTPFAKDIDIRPVENLRYQLQTARAANIALKKNVEV
ncbi:MAG: hypothetical protein K9G62_08220 [Alphaproteobacteria bacterium]|nr:hypothetical protein [Alphaproteobacteria bacterium]